MPGDNLTRVEAQERNALLDVETYDIALDVTTGPVTPPLSLRDISYAGGRVSMPTNRAAGGEELLAEHLLEGAAILDAAPPPDLSTHPAHVSADFEHLRWFDLPSSALT